MVRKKQEIVVGTKTDSKNNMVKIFGVPKFVPLHVYRLAPDTKLDSVFDFLKPHFPEVVGEKLISRHPDEYSLFKICVHEEHFQLALDSSIWPRNACIRLFFQVSRRINTG